MPDSAIIAGLVEHQFPFPSKPNPNHTANFFPGSESNPAIFLPTTIPGRPTEQTQILPIKSSFSSAISF